MKVWKVSVRVSVVATGIDNPAPTCQTQPAESLLTELAGRLRNVSRHIAGRTERNAPLPQLEKSAGPPSGPPSRRAARKPEYGICAPCGSAGARSVRSLLSCTEFH